MTNAEQIQSIKERAEALRAEMESRYSELEDNPLQSKEHTEMLKSGLRLKKESEIFTPEERDFFDRIDATDDEARQILSNLSSEKVQLEKAKETDSMYETPIRVLPLSDLIEENANDTEIIYSVIADLMETRNLATGIGWGRYETLLQGNTERIIAEVKAIINAFEAVSFIETDSIRMEVPYGLYISFEADYYQAEHITLLPESPKTADQNNIEDTIYLFLYHHRKCLEGDSKSLALVDQLVEKKLRELATTPATEIEEASYVTSAIDNFVFAKDKISNNLTRLKSGRPFEIEVESARDRKKGKELITRVQLDFKPADAGITVLSPDTKITPEDRELLWAIFSVWETAAQNGELVDGTAVTTLQKLYRVYTKNPQARLDPSKEEDLSQQILLTLNRAALDINATAESAYYSDLVDFNRQGPLTSIYFDKARVNGVLVANAVHIVRLDLSPLYSYAKAKGQLVTVPLKMLDAKAANSKAKVVKTDDAVTIEGYLIRRIESIPHISNVILIDTLLDEVGIYKENYSNFNKKRSETVKKIENILNGYVDTGYIKSFKFKSKGRIRYYSVVIEK